MTAHNKIRPILKVGFYDFWPGHQPTHNYFFHVLSLRYRVEIDQGHPDVALFSVFGNEHHRVRCKKYHFTGEARKASRETYDYSFSFDDTNEHNYRLPLWVLYLNWFGSSHPNDSNPSYLVPPSLLCDRVVPPKKPLFCNFVYNNPSGERLRFLDVLARRARVDCIGTLAGNAPHLGGDELTKLNALRQYRFTIAFENTIHPGYVTEKILHPLAAQSVPIYWGCREVAADFNSEAFLDARNYASLDALADAVMDIEANPKRWQEMAAAPVFKGGIPARFRPDAVADFFERTI